MADERQAAAKAAAQAAHQANPGKNRQAYIVHVYDECWAPVEEPPGTSASARLDEIEQRLQQILGLLEQRGS